MTPEPRPMVRVMLVDDERKFRELLERILFDDGFVVAASVGTAEQAIAAIDGADPDVVVLDYTLPGSDGLWVADEMCRRRPGQPVIVFSSLFDLALRREVEERGYVYVEKVDGVQALESAILASLSEADRG